MPSRSLPRIIFQRDSLSKECHCGSRLPDKFPSKKSHIREPHTRGITATRLTGDDVDEEKLLRGHNSFTFGVTYTKEKWRRKMLQSEVYLKNIFAIVTDEAHVIPKW